MSKRGVVIATVCVTLLVLAFIKNPEVGSDKISDLFNWVKPW